MQIVNAAKTTVVKYYYDAWGYNFATEGSLASTVGAVNPIRYRGYYYDSGTGLYYLHSRYYNPELRRFISPDKLLDTRSLDGYNLFAYCGNNPTGKTDSTGTIPVNALTSKKEGWKKGKNYSPSYPNEFPSVSDAIDSVGASIDTAIDFGNILYSSHSLVDSVNTLDRVSDLFSAIGLSISITKGIADIVEDITTNISNKESTTVIILDTVVDIVYVGGDIAVSTLSADAISAIPYAGPVLAVFAGYIASELWAWFWDGIEFHDKTLINHLKDSWR